MRVLRVRVRRWLTGYVTIRAELFGDNRLVYTGSFWLMKCTVAAPSHNQKVDGCCSRKPCTMEICSAPTLRKLSPSIEQTGWSLHNPGTQQFCLPSTNRKWSCDGTCGWIPQRMAHTQSETTCHTWRWRDLNLQASKKRNQQNSKWVYTPLRNPKTTIIFVPGPEWRTKLHAQQQMLLGRPSRKDCSASLWCQCHVWCRCQIWCRCQLASPPKFDTSNIYVAGASC